MALVNQITLPPDILERVQRVLQYHDSTRFSPESLREDPIVSDPANQPYEFRVFEMRPNVPLPTGMLDWNVPTLSLMQRGLEAVPLASIGPPQDLRTLATWLHFADGIATRRRTVTATHFTRTCFSDGGCFPQELYIAAFAVEGLEPGFYHYTPREFALRKLRDGPETLARLTRGRPDLAFLKTVPAALMVSTIFCRSTWRFGRRGYRHALHDAGYLVQNLVTVATGLGIQTMTRLQLNDLATRDLIGVAADADFSQAEAVQGMVVWADRATCPIATAPSRAGEMTSSSAAAMPMIERTELANEVTPYVSILETHLACVAPGVAVRELRSPLTDLSPLPPNQTVQEDQPVLKIPPGEPLRKVLLTRQATSHCASRGGITREQLLIINRCACRGGTFFPLHPEGPHVALARPFWILHDVTGMDAGLWYYHPPTDQWSILRHGNFRQDVAKLTPALETLPFARCSAACILTANLGGLLPVAGPDVYRLAHIESGIVTNRLALSSEALDLAWFESGAFFDDHVREFLGLHHSGWEVLNVVAVGNRAGAAAS